MVTLREVTPADLPALHQFQLDEQANRMAAVIPRDAQAFEALWSKVLKDPAVWPRAILADGELAGSISCFKMDGLDAVGYWIAREQWGRGIATAALRLLLTQVSVRPLHARVAAHNEASLRVLTRCGFAVVGRRFSPGDARYLECEEVVLELRESV